MKTKRKALLVSEQLIRMMSSVSISQCLFIHVDEPQSPEQAGHEIMQDKSKDNRPCNHKLSLYWILRVEMKF